MKELKLKELAAACDGVWAGDPAALGQSVSAITTDSREITAGCLFAAMPGARVDGHDFVAGALEQGALAALVQRIPDGVSGGCVLVHDTLAGLQDIAACYRRKFDIPIVGVTGSVGKTTAKEMIAAVLGRRYAVHKTAGNFNNDLGVPLTLFGLEAGHGAAVVELGVSHPGDMARLARMVRPTLAVFTVIGDAHLEFLGSRAGVLAEKSVVNDFLPSDGAVICSGDDPLLAAMECARRKVTFGLGPDCAVRAEQVETLADGTTACRITAPGRCIDAVIPAYGEHMVYAALAAAAVGMELGLTDGEIAAGIGDYAPVGHRARRVETGRIVIIDDCYNANPTSTAAALRSLARSAGRKVCILGDMLELGAASAQLHYDIGALARDCGAALVLTAGTEAAEIARGAGGAGRHFAQRETLIAALPELIETGDTVLVKASHSLHFEEVTEALMKL